MTVVASRQNRNNEFWFIVIASMIQNYITNMQYSNGITFWYGISLLIVISLKLLHC